MAWLNRRDNFYFLCCLAFCTKVCVLFTAVRSKLVKGKCSLSCSGDPFWLWHVAMDRLPLLFETSLEVVGGVELNCCLAPVAMHTGGCCTNCLHSLIWTYVFVLCCLWSWGGFILIFFSWICRNVSQQTSYQYDIKKKFFPGNASMFVCSEIAASMTNPMWTGDACASLQPQRLINKLRW